MLRARWAVDASSEEGRRVVAEFERLFAQHAPFVERVLRRFGVAAGDVADASQEVFLVVLRRLPEFEARGSHRTWLYRICVCVAADYRKRAHRRYERTGDEAARAEVAHDQESRAADRELLARLECSLQRLPDEQRQVFVLYDLEELSMAEIAELLGCPLKTAFSRLYAARREIRRELARAGYACMPWTLIALRPWRAHASSGLRAAMEAWGVPASGGAVATSGGALLSYGAGALPMALLAVAMTVRPADEQVTTVADHGPVVNVVVAEPEAVRVHAPEPEPESESESESEAVRVHVPVPEPKPKPTRPRSRPRTVAAPAAMAAAPSAASDWIRAPEPTRPSAPPPASPRAGVGLDEVLSATSIDSLTRFTPAHGPRRPIALVPPRGRVQRGAQ